MKVIKRQSNAKNCIICGLDNSFGLKAAFYEMEDKSVCALFNFLPEHQSYPTRTHGGMITALLDEVMGRALWSIEPDVYACTTTLSVSFRKAVPYGVPLKAPDPRPTKKAPEKNTAKGLTIFLSTFSFLSLLYSSSTKSSCLMSPSIWS
ncbi:MAG: PaaI family thioesterase [Clostridia bacterium]|nr:PaaI family thioesterase [Clostridia bacterium]